MAVQVAIIGAGLTGLSIARALQAKGVSYSLIEARDRLGGRILTEHLGAAGFDLGPSWFWPGQPRMAALVESLDLVVFEQFAEGALLYETEQGEVVRDRGFSSMQGSLRIRGGMGALVAGIAKELPEEVLHVGRPVVSVSQSGVVGLADRGVISADVVVIAVPPRVAAGISFDPALPPSRTDALRAIPTWMAGHAKCVAVYDRPFWRARGLSGDAMSRIGPMVEIHDASTDDNGALFGFLGVPPEVRAKQADAVKAACAAQFVRLFGEDAGAPMTVFYTDWATQQETATDAGLTPLTHHPTYGRPAPMFP